MPLACNSIHVNGIQSGFVPPFYLRKLPSEYAILAINVLAAIFKVLNWYCFCKIDVELRSDGTSNAELYWTRTHLILTLNIIQGIL